MKRAQDLSAGVRFEVVVDDFTDHETFLYRNRYWLSSWKTNSIDSSNLEQISAPSKKPDTVSADNFRGKCPRTLSPEKVSAHTFSCKCLRTLSHVLVSSHNVT